jgi:ABC-type sugar transport system ATPase subunit
MLEEGVGVLLVSSDMLEILGLADRIVVLHERRVVGELDRADATEERLALLSAGGRGLRTAA